ncbi:sugar O-acetyltransferase [Lentilactobacillus hilgardii]|nr:sugar O-acetyltransferase [Lentilactobacillus hilgardii]
MVFKFSLLLNKIRENAIRLNLKEELAKMANGDLYDQTPELLEIRMKVRDLLYQYNRLNYRDLTGRYQLLSKIFKQIGSHCFVEIPFHIDYGLNTSLGENFFANNNLTILDAAPVTIGDNVLFAPNVGLYTAGHALDPKIRQRSGAEFAFPIHIGNNVWLGANVTVTPGATIGDNSVIGAGSVVTKDIPANVLAYGDPAKVVRQLGEIDRKYYAKHRPMPQKYLDAVKNHQPFKRI